MSKNTRKSSEVQLSFFDKVTDSKLPLPDLIAQGSDDWQPFPLSYHDINNKRNYAIQDWISGIAQPVNPSKYWNDMKRRALKANIELSARCGRLSYVAKNGRTYQVDHCDAETLYVITARMDTETGVRNEVIEYLAKAGVLVDEIRLDPGKAIQIGKSVYQAHGKDEVWIDRRTKTIVTRNDLTDTVKAIVSGTIDFATLTNVEYQGLFKRTAAQLRKQSGNKSARDGMTVHALGFVQIAEDTCNTMLKGRDEVGFDEACGIMAQITSILGVGVDELNKLLHMDIATGQTLIGDMQL